MKPEKTFGNTINRRSFIKGISISMAGLAVHKIGFPGKVSAAETVSDINRVSFVTGTDRRKMVFQTIKPFEEEIKKAIQNKQVIIKPNFVVTEVPLCATHADAVRGVLDFLKPVYNKKVIIAESTISGNGTMTGFENYGYMPLIKEYNVELLDLNLQPTTYKWILDNNLHPVAIPIINTYLDPNNYFISITRLKTHDRVVATLGIKNMVMGSPLNKYKVQNYKGMMHPGRARLAHYNMFLIAEKIHPDLTILDGLEGMQGNGPVGGFPMEHGVALASTDPVAADTIGAGLMGIDINDVGYVKYCGNAGMGQTDRSKITIIGKDPANYIKKYQLHENIEKQLEWKGSIAQ